MIIIYLLKTSNNQPYIKYNFDKHKINKICQFPNFLRSLSETFMCLIRSVSALRNLSPTLCSSISVANEIPGGGGGESNYI